MIAALYIDPDGPYPTFEGVDCWPRERDATTYEGPWPVVAHPACGPWGNMSHQYGGHEGGPELAIRAVEQVRAWGGVPEHPAGSRLWKHCELPLPGAPADASGGYTIAVAQSDWGHPCRKRTWLYCVRVPREALHFPPPREPVAWIGGGRRRGRRRPDGRLRAHIPDHIRIATKRERVLTPPLFALYLLSLAEATLAP